MILSSKGIQIVDWCPTTVVILVAGEMHGVTWKELMGKLKGETALYLIAQQVSLHEALPPSY